MPKTRPGVMLYFEDLRPALRRLDDAQCGALLRAVMAYAEHSELPALDPMAAVIFEMLQPKLDRDAARYEENREQRQYAAYSREAKRRGEQPLNLAEWRQRQTGDTGRHEPSRAVTDDAPPSPSTSASASTSTTASPSASASASASPSASASAGGGRGEGDDAQALRLYRQWRQSRESGDTGAAMALSSQLYRLGYRVDPLSCRLSRREDSG